MIAISALVAVRNPLDDDRDCNRVDCERHVRLSFVTRRNAIHQSDGCRRSSVKISMGRVSNELNSIDVIFYAIVLSLANSMKRILRNICLWYFYVKQTRDN